MIVCDLNETEVTLGACHQSQGNTSFQKNIQFFRRFRGGGVMDRHYPRSTLNVVLKYHLYHTHSYHCVYSASVTNTMPLLSMRNR